MKQIYISSLLLVSLLVPTVSSAAFYKHYDRDILTSRRIKEQAEYQQKARLIERKTGSTTVRKSNRFIDRSSTIPERINSRIYQPTPKLNDVRFSSTARLPISDEAQSAYIIGINYYTGRSGYQKSDIAAYIWMSFAQAKGHPLARDSLMKITRRMTATQLRRAKENIKIIARDFLKFPDQREVLIRDIVRQNDIDDLKQALYLYWFYADGYYPVHISKTKPVEICRLGAVTCFQKFNLQDLVPGLLQDIPVDPFEDPLSNGTGYYLVLDQDGMPYLLARYAETRRIDTKNTEIIKR